MIGVEFVLPAAAASTHIISDNAMHTYQITTGEYVAWDVKFNDITQHLSVARSCEAGRCPV
jgi:hypothetical protein